MRRKRKALKRARKRSRSKEAGEETDAKKRRKLKAALLGPESISESDL